MRIGLVLYGDINTLSGGYLYDRMLRRQIQLLGHEVCILTLPWRDYANHLGDNWNRQWLQQVANARVDLLIQDELNHPSLLLANRRPRSIPFVSLVHHLRSSELDHRPLLRALYRQVESLYLNSVDAFLCNSHTTWQSVQRLLHRPRPYTIAYPAADHLSSPDGTPGLADIAARARRPGPLHLLFVGNLIKRKGLHTILSALATLPPGLFHLSVVGQGDPHNDYTKEIQQMACSLPGGAVTFCGRLSDEQLALQYRTNHVFVLPSYEGFGIVYLEAMRFGLPAIATTAGAAHELIADGHNGFLIQPDGAGALAKYLLMLQANREMLLVMSAGARQRYHQHPTWEQSMTPAVHWLATLLGQNV